MASNSAIPLHKKMAMGQGTGYASGGAVVQVPRTAPMMGRMIAPPRGMPGNPLTTAKRMNGVPALKGGGGVKNPAPFKGGANETGNVGGKAKVFAKKSESGVDKGSKGGTGSKEDRAAKLCAGGRMK